MMDWTDRHCRAFHRHLTRRALLYTAMVTADAVRFGDRARLLGFSAEAPPVALTLGRSAPMPMDDATRLAGAAGYEEAHGNIASLSHRAPSRRQLGFLMSRPTPVR